MLPMHQPTEESRPTFDLPRLASAVREMLVAIGEDPDRDGLSDTPHRVAKAWTEIFSGLTENPEDHLTRTFKQEAEDLVTLRDIEFTSICEHHLLPVFGRAHIAYLPSNRRVVGLSKLARTVEVFARRPQLQERMTAQVADAIMEYLAPRGVLVVVDAEHMCMKMRGVEKSGAVMRTVASRGLFATRSDRRLETLATLGVAAPQPSGMGARKMESAGALSSFEIEKWTP